MSERVKAKLHFLQLSMFVYHGHLKEIMRHLSILKQNFEMPPTQSFNAVDLPYKVS
jgi:hypothetical protein